MIVPTATAVKAAKASARCTTPLPCTGCPSTSSAKKASRPEQTAQPASNASAARFLQRRGPVPVGQLGAALGITRQQLIVALTPAGQDYAQAIISVIADLNRDVAGRVDDADLAAAVSVLQAAMFDDGTRRRAAALLRRTAAGPGL
jgi:hypothetical protein